MKTLVLQAGVALRAQPGQAVHGDAHVIQHFDGGCLIAAVDGLGHGAEAAKVAGQAAALMAARPDGAVLDLLRTCHDALRNTRGVVMSLASFNAVDRTMTWAGVGNVEGVLLRKDATSNSDHEMLLSRGGVVGQRLPRLVASVVPVSPGDTLLLATDGVTSGFWRSLPLEEAPQRMAERIVASFASGTDDALVVAARYLGYAR